MKQLPHYNPKSKLILYFISSIYYPGEWFYFYQTREGAKKQELDMTIGPTKRKNDQKRTLPTGS